MDPGYLVTVLPPLIVNGIVGVSALSLLVMLFSRIVDECINIWASQVPQNMVVIEAGKMRLEFGCTFEPVPWEFVLDFSASQREAVRRGFAPVYEKEWWFDRTDRSRICYVGIRIAPDNGTVLRPGHF